MPRATRSITLPFTTHGQSQALPMADRLFIETTFAFTYHRTVFYANKKDGRHEGRVKLSAAGYGPDFSRLRTVRGTLSPSFGWSQLQPSKAHTLGIISICFRGKRAPSGRYT